MNVIFSCGLDLDQCSCVCCAPQSSGCLLRRTVKRLQPHLSLLAGKRKRHSGAKQSMRILSL